MSRTGSKAYKRRSEWVDGTVEGEVVDDLAHAATFAMMTSEGLPSQPEYSVTSSAGIMRENKEADAEEAETDEISIDDSATSSDSDDQSEVKNRGYDVEEGNDEDKDDDDDQSDVDLAAELAQMDPEETIDEEDGDGIHSNRASLPPKTENEVDAYKTPIQELEKHLQFQLSVSPDASNVTVPNVSALSTTLRLAGKIKHYMALDRTVVVESSVSNPHGDASSFATENAPLDEGTLLLLRPPPSMIDDKKTEDEEILIPLGRIFEIFGPVSKPLYTIRLPVPTKKTIYKRSDDTPSLPTQTSAPESNILTSVKNDKTAKDEDSSDTIGDCTVSTIDSSPAIAGSIQVDDPWAAGGKYASLLQPNESYGVYYAHNEAKLIDMGTIMKLSRKGCDASNLYDEEVIHANEMYYSDDEEERQAKNRKKRGANQERRRGPNSIASPSKPLPSGFHASGPTLATSSTKTLLPPGFHPEPSITRNSVPAGFHPRTPFSSRGGPPPPPPPPPNGGGPPPTYQY